jgi:hypothetical protein
VLSFQVSALLPGHASQKILSGKINIIHFYASHAAMIDWAIAQHAGRAFNIVSHDSSSLGKRAS